MLGLHLLPSPWGFFVWSSARAFLSNSSTHSCKDFPSLSSAPKGKYSGCLITLLLCSFLELVSFLRSLTLLLILEALPQASRTRVAAGGRAPRNPPAMLMKPLLAGRGTLSHGRGLPAFAVTVKEKGAASGWQLGAEAAAGSSCMPGGWSHTAETFLFHCCSSYSLRHSACPLLLLLTPPHELRPSPSCSIPLPRLEHRRSQPAPTRQCQS